MATGAAGGQGQSYRQKGEREQGGAAIHHYLLIVPACAELSKESALTPRSLDRGESVVVACSLREMPDGFAAVLRYAYRMVIGVSAESDLLRVVRRYAHASEAPSLLRIASAILGVDLSSADHRDEILRLCRVLASEGGLVQEMAEEIGRELARR